jgi:hypothetical protein
MNAVRLDTADPRRWLASLLLLVAIALVPWTVALGWQLPARHTSHHWDAAWIGFDIALIAAVAATAYGLARQRLWVQIPAAVSAALLLTDAWFDNLLADGTHEHVVAALEAGIGELPLALICLWVGLHAEQACAAVLRARGRLRR